MKQSLPWNVTGIPPEAREAARNAASREGMTVGDWLTRRILAEAAGSPQIETPLREAMLRREPEVRREPELRREAPIPAFRVEREPEPRRSGESTVTRLPARPE